MITPDNFRANPLGWAGNQAGHMMICAALAFVLSMAWFYVFGEYPYRWALALAIAAIYLAIELPQHGGFWDSLEDTIFVCGYGGAMFLFPFQEIERGNAMLTFNPSAIELPLFVLSMHIVLGMTIRELQRRGIIK